jgi:hypothetical protein
MSVLTKKPKGALCVSKSQPKLSSPGAQNQKYLITVSRRDRWRLKAELDVMRTTLSLDRGVSTY